MPANTSRNVQVKTEPEDISEPQEQEQQPEISTPQPSSPGSVAASEQSEMPLAATTTPKKVTVSTPVSTPQQKEDDLNKTYGSVATPGGRRSARIAQSAKKAAR